MASDQCILMLIGWTLNFGVAARFMTMVQTIPLSAFGKTIGLLGVYDGQPNNDLTAPDGTVFSTESLDINLENLHNEFGLKCE